MALSRQAIVEAGLGILDAYGLGDLSMRRVADVLNVQAGALYYHVPNKQSLLAALSDEILAEVPGPDVTQPTAVWLAGWAGALRAALLSHRDGAELVATSLAMGLGVRQPHADVERWLLAAGEPEPEATAATVIHFVLGHVVEEQTKAQMSALGVIGSYDRARMERRFLLGVGIVVAGAATLVRPGESG